MIKTLADLKKNVIFSMLDTLQSTLDNSDTVIRDANFTRSPFQLVSFLVTYAGLDSATREYVINHLPKVEGITVSKKEVDALIESIDWTTLLTKNAKSALAFDLQVGLANPELYYQEIQKNCPELLNVLKSKNCIVQIEQADEVIFTTKVDQTVSWVTPFDREAGENYWTVENFVLSPELKNKISSMATDDSWDCNSIVIKKGHSNNVELRIRAPKGSNEYSAEVKNLEVNSGIYQAFQGLKNFYGLSSVDIIKVELSNNATFSDKGATASQTQVVTLIAESASFSLDKPTVITIDAPLNVLYQGIDLMTCLGTPGKNTKAAQEIENATSYYVILPTKEAGTGIELYPVKLTPIEVHDLNFNSAKAPKPSSNNEGEFLFSATDRTDINDLKTTLEIELQGCIVFHRGRKEQKIQALSKLYNMKKTDSLQDMLESLNKDFPGYRAGICSGGFFKNRTDELFKKLVGTLDKSEEKAPTKQM